MRDLPPELDVQGPVLAEVFVLWLAGDHVELTGPCGAAPWLIEVGAAEHPMDVVPRLLRRAVGEPVLVHSTSWRRDRDAVVLSFVAVIDDSQVGVMDTRPIGRSDLARGGATAAPASVEWSQVVEHGLRHLAWLAKDDPVVAARLSPGWHGALAGYLPEPFRSLG